MAGGPALGHLRRQAAAGERFADTSTVPSVEANAPNPRAPRRRSSAELARSVRAGRHFAEALRALGLRGQEPDADDRALAEELARVLV
ncbi:MAG: hypothetical protein JWQ20_2296, partial [Conexibacter sp.]|nr:hypothetical protein [Conexibacter sp.]